MKQYHADTSQQLPLVIEPGNENTSKDSLLQWLKQNDAAFRKEFYKTGAVLFRGFDLNTPKDFEDIALHTDPHLQKDYYGTSPRNAVQGTTYIYTASELPGHYPIMQHCEMSYAAKPPVTLFFYCHIQPTYGGETPLCDFRKVYAQMDERIRNEFDRKGVITVRNYSGLESKSRFNLFELKKWNEIFHTTNKQEVEKQCREQNIEWEWLEGGNLRLLHRTPASKKNPVTGEMAWFNHLQVFHPHAAAVEYDYIHQRQGRAKTFFWKLLLKVMVKAKKITNQPIEESMNVLFGDGSPVPDSYVEHIEELIWKNLVIIPWKKNDVLAIDNFSVAHGRLPFEGPREILVCWST